MGSKRRFRPGQDPVTTYFTGEHVPPWVSVDAAIYLAVKSGYMEGETVDSLARRLHISSRTVLRWAARDDWPKGRDNRAHSEMIREHARQLWRQGYTYAQIQQALSISASTVFRWRKAGRWPSRRTNASR